MRIYLLILALCFQNFTFAQVDDDLQILNRLIEKSLQPIQDFLIYDSVKSVKLNFISSNHKLNDLVKINLLKTIDEDSNSVYSLDVFVKKWDVSYPELVSYSLFGEEKIKREISLEISYLFSKNGYKITSYDFVETFIDTLNLSQISELNSKFSSRLPDIPIYRRLIEPVIISAVTGAIIYLFFITRSK